MISFFFYGERLMVVLVMLTLTMMLLMMMVISSKSAHHNAVSWGLHGWDKPYIFTLGVPGEGEGHTMCQKRSASNVT